MARSTTAASYPGTLHHFAPRLVAFEHTPSSPPGPQTSSSSSQHPTPSPQRPQATNFLLFLPGLNDSLLTVPYTPSLASSLPPNWSLVEIQLSSAGPGWTTSNLNRDADELALAVGYLRDLARERREEGGGVDEDEEGDENENEKKEKEKTKEKRKGQENGENKIVLMGHSTGAQICTTYLIGPVSSSSPPSPVASRPEVHGLILQAGISDREGAVHFMPPPLFSSSLQIASRWIQDGKGGDILPGGSTGGICGAEPSAERWVSLVAKEGDDDLFSSDLGDERVERVWGRESGVSGRVGSVLVLLGEWDEYMPPGVDKELLLRRWLDAMRVGEGGDGDDSGNGTGTTRKSKGIVQGAVVPGASHNLSKSSPEVVEDLCGRVARFLEALEAAG